jgi:hypothetical protein
MWRENESSSRHYRVKNTYLIQRSIQWCSSQQTTAVNEYPRVRYNIIIFQILYILLFYRLLRLLGSTLYLLRTYLENIYLVQAINTTTWMKEIGTVIKY